MNKLHTNIFSPQTFDLLKSIQSNRFFNNFYLVGGTALSLYLGHRRSYDLDFFSQTEFPANLTSHLKFDYQVFAQQKNSIELNAKATKLMFFYFAFPLYKKIVNIQGIRMADPVDIGLMKLLALQGRSTKKDIVDLYFIDRQIIKLEELLNIFEDFYPKASFNSYSSLKQILNISEIELSPIPIMLENFSFEQAWECVSSKVSWHIKQLLRH